MPEKSKKDDFDFIDTKTQNEDPLSKLKLKGKTRDDKIKEIARAIRLLLNKDNE